MKNRNFILLSSAVLASGVLLSMFLYKRGSFKRKLVRKALEELEKWKGVTETAPQASAWLLGYWNTVGRAFTALQMQSAAVHARYPWSSAFISWLFYQAGAGKRFPYTAAHSGYFQLAKMNRNQKGAYLRGFRITEYAPQVGDLLVYSRTQGKGYDSSGHFAAHGELVVQKGRGFVKTVSGNVANGVRAAFYPTDPKGFLKVRDPAFFMVIQNTIFF